MQAAANVQNSRRKYEVFKYPWLNWACIFKSPFHLPLFWRWTGLEFWTDLPDYAEHGDPNYCKKRFHYNQEHVVNFARGWSSTILYLKTRMFHDASSAELAEHWNAGSFPHKKLVIRYTTEIPKDVLSPLLREAETFAFLQSLSVWESMQSQLWYKKQT